MVPVLLMAGREDRKARPEQVEMLFDRVRSHARLVVFERAGHLHFDETDHKLYRDSILGFLHGTTVGSVAVSGHAR